MDGFTNYFWAGDPDESGTGGLEKGKRGWGGFFLVPKLLP